MLTTFWVIISINKINIIAYFSSSKRFSETCLMYIESNPRKKNESRRESRWESCIQSDPRLSARLFGAKSLVNILAKSLTECLGRVLVILFAPKSLAKSLGSDYMYDSRRDSLRDSFFYEGRPIIPTEYRREHSAGEIEIKCSQVFYKTA